jgi:hypothetical protein
MPSDAMVVASPRRRRLIVILVLTFAALAKKGRTLKDIQEAAGA